LLKRIYNLGIEFGKNSFDRAKIRLLNQTITIFLFAILIKFFNELLVFDVTGLMVVSPIFLLFTSILIFQKKGKLKIARTGFLLIFLFVLSFLLLAFGRGFGAEFGFLLAIMLITIFIKKIKFQVLWFLIIVAIMIGIHIIQLKYEPFLIENLNPNSFFFMLISCCFGLFYVARFFINENSSLLNELKSNNEILIKTKDQVLNQNEELKTANAELESLSYATSHDLKTPLQNILNFTRLSREKIDEEPSAKIDKYLSISEENAAHMNKTIDSLLGHTRIHKINTVKELIDVKKSVEEVIIVLQERIKERNIEINTKEIPLIKTDGHKLKMLLQNLLDNAIKYNDKEIIKIDIYSSIIEDEFNIHVKDNGIGIKEDQQHKIFDMFTRLHLQDKYQGSGIGLSTVKRLIQQMNGKIKVKSKLGVGSEFILSFPKALIQNQ
jgi:signal transduction histidine kinase